MLISISCIAGDRYRYVWIDETISGIDRVKIKRVIKNKLFDRTEIKVTDLPRWRKISSTNIIGRIVSIDVGKRKFNFTVTNVRMWLRNNISQTNKVLIISANSSKEAKAKAGLEAINSMQ